MGNIIKGLKPRQVTLVKVVPEMFFLKSDNGGKVEYNFATEAWETILDFSIPDLTQSPEEIGAVGQARLIEQLSLNAIMHDYYNS